LEEKNHGLENIVFEHLDLSSTKTNQILVKETQHAVNSDPGSMESHSN
jgi:hypothetical protein